MPASDDKWIVQLAPCVGHTTNDILKTHLALDVWERRGETLIASAPESTLRELERRRLATVERIRLTKDYERWARELGKRPPSKID